MINLPKNWDEITITQFNELNAINSDNFENVDLINLEKLSILSNVDSDDDIWDDMDIRIMNKIIKDLDFLTIYPNGVTQDIILEKYHRYEFSKLTLGEYIDLDYYYQENPFSCVHFINAILYRQIKIGDWGNMIYESYDIINLNERAELILNNCKVGEAFGIVSEFSVWRNNFLEMYKSLFEPEIEDDFNADEMDEEELQEQEQEHKEREEEEDKRQNKGNGKEGRKEGRRQVRRK